MTNLYRIIRNDPFRAADTHNSHTKVHQWQYVPAANDWAYSTGYDEATETFELTEKKLVTSVPGSDDEIITTELRDASNNLISKKQVTDRQFEWGRGGYISQIKDFGGTNLESTAEYYTDAEETGRYGNLKFESKPGGYWARYDYDSDSRMIQMVEVWEDTQPEDTEQT